MSATAVNDGLENLLGQVAATKSSIVLCVDGYGTATVVCNDKFLLAGANDITRQNVNG